MEEGDVIDIYREQLGGTFIDSHNKAIKEKLSNTEYKIKIDFQAYKSFLVMPFDLRKTIHPTE